MMRSSTEKSCLNYVNLCIHRLEQRKQEYYHHHHHLPTRTNSLHGYTLILEHQIRQCVESSLIYQRIEIERDIALVYFQYTNTQLKRAYRAQSPVKDQVNNFFFIY